MKVFKLTAFFAAGMTAACLMVSSAQASPFATELVAHSDSLNASHWYNDPNDILGKPAEYCNSYGGKSHVSIVEPSWGDGFITSFNNADDWAVVKFDHKVMDDPNNPYGLDFLVFGNAFFNGTSGVGEKTNHDEYKLTGYMWAEQVTVSVSQNGTDWYTYENGPYGDSLYPTNPWVWDSDLWAKTESGWTDQQNDFTKPVDPSLTLDDFKGLTTAQAMALYQGSAGGTGFDLTESGLEWIQYIKVTGTGGEVDAFADVAAVPVPGAFWLLGSGLVCLAGLRRKTP